MGVTVTSGPLSMGLGRCLAILLSSFFLGFAAEWVARDAGIQVKFRLLGISLGWPGVFASASFLVAFHALSIRTKPAA